MDNPWASPWADETPKSPHKTEDLSVWKTSDSTPAATEEQTEYTAPSWSAPEAVYEAPTVWGSSDQTWTTSDIEQQPEQDRISDQSSEPEEQTHSSEVHAEPEPEPEPAPPTPSQPEEAWPSPQAAAAVEPVGYLDAGNAWESPSEAWGGSAVHTTDIQHDDPTDENAEPDEWETARKEREALDRTVPPDFLPSILKECDHVSDEIWSKPKSDDENTSFRPTIDNIPGLTEMLDRVSTPISNATQVMTFNGSALSKRMSEAIKYTRHSGVAQKSPMSVYLASKGSMSWGNTFKPRTSAEIEEIPKGWKAVSDANGVTRLVLDDGEDSKPKTATSILSSIFNRKNESEASSPVVKADSNGTKSPPLPATERVTAIASSVIAAVAPTKTDVDAEMPLVNGPSAVSRFWDRFNIGASSSHRLHSRALSEDDFDEFTDMVPSALDDEDGLDALTSMIATPAGKPKPVPVTNVPAPKPSTALIGSLVDFDPVAVKAPSPPQATISPPPRSINGTPILKPPPRTNSTNNFFAPPPASSSSRIKPPTSPTTYKDDSFDDFEDFQTVTPPPIPTKTASLISADFDDFDDFVTTSSSPPPPPPPPAKSPRHQRNDSKPFTTPPRIPGPPSSTVNQTWDFINTSSPSIPAAKSPPPLIPSPPPSTNTAATGAGGLSAQDLSFFEGL